MPPSKSGTHDLGAPRPPPGGMDRRAFLGRLAGTTAVAWAAPQVIATSSAHAMSASSCPALYDFDDGTLQGWNVAGTGPAAWQVNTAASSSGTSSVWFGNPGSADSLHPVVGADSYGGGTSRGTLTSPPVVVTSSDTISFNVRLAIESNNSYDRFRLYIVQGSRRRLLWRKSNGGFTIADHPENPGSSYDMMTTSGGFVPITIGVGSPNGINLSKPVQFEFDFQSVDGVFNRTEGVYLDDISVPCTVALEAVTTQTSSSSSFEVGGGAKASGYLPGYLPPLPEYAEIRG